MIQQSNSNWVYRFVPLAVLVPGLALAQGPERHIAEGRHVPVFTQGIAAETRGDSLSEAGHHEEAKGAYKEAVFHYQRALVLAPDELPTHIRLARVLGLLHKHLQAAAVLKRMGERYPTNLELKELIGVRLVLGGKSEQGIAVLEQVVSAKRKTLAVLMLLADHYRNTGRATKAIGVLRSILEQQPDAHDRRVELGWALLRLGKRPEAQTTFAKVPRQSRRYPAAQIGLADALLQANETQKALDLLLQLELKAFFARSRPLVTDFKRSERQLIKPSPKPLLVRIGQARLALGHYAKADKRYRAVIRLDPEDPRGHYGLGETMRRRRRYREAIGPLSRAAQLNPRSPRLYSALARSHAGAGSLPEAIAWQKRAVRLAPRDWRLEGYLGALYRRNGELQRAVALHTRLVGTHGWSAVLLTELAHDFHYLDQPDKALARYEEALKRNPTILGARRGIVSIRLKETRDLLQGSKPQLAESKLRDLLKYNAYQPQILERLAALAIAEQEPARAQAWLGRLEPGTGASWTTRLLRAQAYVLDHKGAEALRELEGISLDSLPPIAKPAAELTYANAELLEGRQLDSAVGRLSKLRALPKPPAGVDRLLAAALVARAYQRWLEGKVHLALADASVALKSKVLSRQDRRRALLVRALSAAEKGDRRVTLADMRRFDRSKPPPSLFSSSYRSRSGRTHLRAYVRYRRGDYRGVITSLRPLVRGRSPAARQLLPLYRAALRAAIYGHYVRGRYQVTQSLIAELRRTTPKLEATDELLIACIDYMQNRKAPALEVFQKLAREVPEARLNLGIHKDVTGENKKAAYEAYIAYLRRAGPRAAPQVREWAETKRRIFGFSEQP